MKKILLLIGMMILSLQATVFASDVQSVQGNTNQSTSADSQGNPMNAEGSWYAKFKQKYEHQQAPITTVSQSDKSAVIPESKVIN